MTKTISPPNAIERRPLFEQLADRVREMILAGDYAPGQRLQEKELSETFGVSRTPMREALKVLSSEGLVTLAPNRGAAVTRLNDEELAETFPVMGALEALAGELACTHATDEEIENIARLHWEMIDAFGRRALNDYYTVNESIHTAILEAARNTTLTKQVEQLAGRARRSRFQGEMSEERWRQAVDEHEHILDRLRARDSAGLAEALRRHVDTKFVTVKEGLGGDTA